MPNTTTPEAAGPTQKAIRLTQAMRDACASHILKHAEERVGAEFLARHEALMARVLAEAIGGPAGLRKLKALPKGWMPAVKGIGVSAGGYQGILKSAVSHCVPYSLNQTYRYVVQDADLSQEIQRLFTDEKRHQDARNALSAKVRALFGGVSTDKQLRQMAPEIYEQVKGILPSDEPRALSVPVKDVVCAIAGMRGEARADCKEAA